MLPGARDSASRTGSRGKAAPADVAAKGLLLCLIALAPLAAGPVAAHAQAPTTYTWTLVESPSIHLRWPNELASGNSFEADGGLLGRVLSSTLETTASTCGLAESHPCAAGEPPAVLFGDLREGPANSASGIECNRKTIACSGGSLDIPGAHTGHPGGTTPSETPMGEFSYLVVQRTGGAKGVAFISGGYTTTKQPYACNACPPGGAGRDIDDATALSNPRLSAATQTIGVSLWTTQFADGAGPTGHTGITLAQSGAGQASVCDRGVQFETLTLDACAHESYPVPIKWSVRTYSVDQAQHASRTNPGRCGSPDCYVRSVIIPAALAQSSQAKNVQVRRATTVLPAGAPFGMDNATLDAILFAFTTQRIDQDGDGIEDRMDPCPMDPADLCAQDFFTGSACPAGQVFCADANGDLKCIDAFLCNQRIDANQDCRIDSSDLNRTGGVDNAIQGTEAFAFGLPIGPFDP